MNIKDDFKCLGIFVILWTLIISMFFATTASAQDSTATSQFITQPPSFQLAEPMNPSADAIPQGATITPVRVGDRSRINGVLYSMEANAWLLSEIQRLQVYWILEMDTRVNLVMTWAQHEIVSQQNRHEASMEIVQVRLDARDRHIESLANINRDLVRAARRQARRNRLKLVLMVVGVGAVAGVGGYVIGSVAP